MAVTTCRRCGEPVSPDAATCPHCGAAEPATASAVPKPERDTGTGSRMGRALRAIGCLVIALIILGIAMLVGLFDILF